MNDIRIVMIAAAVVGLRFSCLAGSVPGLVIGWGNNLSVSAAGVPFYCWASPAAAANSALARQPVSGTDPLLTNAVAVACGEFHALALLADGRIAGWGWNGLGQALGTETSSRHSTSGLVKIGGQVLSNATAIAAGRTHSLALTSNGTIVAWGRMNTPRGEEIPMTALTNLAALSAGWSQNLALTRDGTVADWPGSRIPVSLSNIVAVATGAGDYAPSLALKRDGTLIQWGINSLLQPVPVGLTNVVAIAAGGGHCLALIQDGTIKGWGDNNVGQATGMPQLNPPYYSEGTVEINGRRLSNVVAISAGGKSSLALRSDGTVVAWGSIDHRRAAVPAGLSNVVAIAAGGSFCLAITTNAPGFAIQK